MTTGPRIHTRADLLGEALRAEVEGLGAPEGGGGAIVLGDRDLLLDEVVDEAGLDARARAARLGPAGESLLLSIVAAEAGPPLQALGAMPAMRRALGGVLHAAAVAGLTPALLSKLLARLGERAPAAAPRLSEIGRLYGRYRAILGGRLLDEAVAFRRGVEGLAERAPDGCEAGVEVRGLWLAQEGVGNGGPTRHGRLQALSALATGIAEPPWHARAAEGARRSVPLRVTLPAVDGHPALEAALQPLLESLYRYHALDIEEARVPLCAAEGPYGRFLQGLFRPATEAPLVAPGEVPEARLSLCAAPTAAAEARAVARAVRDLLDAGAAPRDITIVAERAPGRAQLLEALRRYGVPARAAPQGQPEGAASVAQAPPIQLVLSIYALLQQGVPREPFIQLLLSQYLRFHKSGPPPWQIARALRESGVRDLRPETPGPPGPPRGEATGAGSGGEEPDHRRRLREWMRQAWFESRAAREKGGLSAGAAPPEPAGGSVVAAVEGALGHLDTLPREATLGVHATALRRLCERLQLEPLGRALTAWAPAPELDDGAALGRDQEGLSALWQVTGALQSAAARLGLHRGRISRERFAQILGAALTQVPLTPRGVEGASVTVTDLLGVAGRRCAHLFVTGLLDGQIPGRAADDPLLPDEERRGLHRMLGHDVFPLAQEGDARAPLHFAAALGGAGAAHLSWPRADEGGRPLLRSPFVDEVLRAAARPEPAAEPLRVVPPAPLARCPQELWMRAAEGGAGRSLWTALAAREPARAARLSRIVEIERARLRWFAARLQPGGESLDLGAAGPFVGRLSDAALRQVLTDRLPGSPGHPLSASALEDYAQCPFRFFVRRVLKAEPAKEGGDDLDALAGGRLHHEVLEIFFKERLQSGCLPLRGDAADREALDRAVDDVLARWPDRERTGHRELFSVRVRRLREDLWRLAEREAQRPIGEGLVPRFFEHKFGPLAISSASERDGGLPLHIYGIIDRVDVGAGRALVLDYKTGRLDRYEQILRHDLLDTSFQLPLYAAALKAQGVLGEEVTEVTARYYSLRSGRATAGELADQHMISLDPQVAAAAPDRNVAEVAYRLWRRLRDGDFRVAPRSCEGCGLEAACRVALVEPAEEPEAAGRSPSPETLQAEKAPGRSRKAAP